jgi:hypothetical protein
VSDNSETRRPELLSRGLFDDHRLVSLSGIRSGSIAASSFSAWSRKSFVEVPGHSSGAWEKTVNPASYSPSSVRPGWFARATVSDSNHQVGGHPGKGTEDPKEASL